MRGLITSLACAVLAVGIANGGQTRAIRSVRVDRTSLNVAANEIVTLTVDFASAGAASVAVVDRDGYLVRTLADAQQVQGGPLSFGWDGRADDSQYVCDEAYSFKVDWQAPGGSDSYFPADSPSTMTSVDAQSYDRRSATLSYSLPRPSRVHIQAGTAVLDSKTQQPAGPVMKTIVNREPRIAGAVAEHWTGFDESGAIFVPDLENFVVAIAATPLPENSVVTFGNRQRRFVEALNTRKGRSLLTPRERHGHHAGLRTLDDVSPELAIEPLDAVWSARDRLWLVRSKAGLRMRLTVKGPTAAAFKAQPANVYLFLDGREIAKVAPAKDGGVEIPLDPGHGIRRISINWSSAWGPLAANTIEVRVDERATTVGATR